MYNKIIAFFDTNNVFFRYIIVVIGIYIAQTLFKISAARKDGTFSWKLLLNGIIDYVIYFWGIMVFFCAGTLIPEVKLLEVNGKSYSIPDALTLLALALIGIQSLKAFKNIRDTFNITDKDTQEVVNDKDAFFKVGENG